MTMENMLRNHTIIYTTQQLFRLDEIKVCQLSLHTSEECKCIYDVHKMCCTLDNAIRVNAE